MALDCSCNRLIEAQEKAEKWDAIVRCGECAFTRFKWLPPRRGKGKREVEWDYICARNPDRDHWIIVRANDFCSRGERVEP